MDKLLLLFEMTIYPDSVLNELELLFLNYCYRDALHNNAFFFLLVVHLWVLGIQGISLKVRYSCPRQDTRDYIG